MTVAAVQRPRVHARMLATASEHQTESPRPHKGRNTTLCITGGLAAIGAIWYYNVVENARIEDEGKKAPSPAVASPGGGSPRAADDASRSVKERTQEALKSADAKYQDVKAEAELKVQEARDQAGQGVDRVLKEAEKKVDAAKSGWWGWLRWGKSQTRETTDDLKHRANETLEVWNVRFEEAKKKAMEKGEDIRQRADETEEDFRNRIAKAIQRR
ncbi:hypothetical protein BJV78DRAFT_1284997 [Lactifluus subvellereus]|nr:hypothetical protein BJV78DRAFT_1284997 [Lactifluus subvellereus]